MEEISAETHDNEIQAPWVLKVRKYKAGKEKSRFKCKNSHTFLFSLQSGNNRYEYNTMESKIMTSITSNDACLRKMTEPQRDDRTTDQVSPNGKKLVSQTRCGKKNVIRKCKGKYDQTKLSNKNSYKKIEYTENLEQTSEVSSSSSSYLEFLECLIRSMVQDY